MDRWYLLLPMTSAFLYAVATLSQKNAIAAGMGPWRMSALTTWFIGAGFIPMFFLAEPMGLPEPLFPPLVAGTLFFFGQLFTIISITRGDVSVATPVLGSKVILVVVFLTVFTADPMSGKTWMAAFLTVFGIVFLQWDPRVEHRGRVWFTVGVAFLSACFFAGADVMVQEGCRESGFYRFMSVSAVATVVWSLGLIPFFNAPIWKLPRGSLKHVLIGCILISLQAVMLAFAIGYFGDAAGANIVYSSRGIWSVVLVWWVGHWFANREREAGGIVLTLRGVGATLIVSAIVLIFL